MDTAFEIPVRLKGILEERNEKGYNTTALAIFNAMRRVAGMYSSAAPGQAWTTQLTKWGETYRAHIEPCIDYLICFKDQDWVDSYEHLYQYIQTIMLVHDRRRKLALLIA